MPRIRPICDDPAEHRRRVERKTLENVIGALHALCDVPLKDEIGLARARRRYAEAKAEWWRSVQDIEVRAGRYSASPLEPRAQQEHQ